MRHAVTRRRVLGSIALAATGTAALVTLPENTEAAITITNLQIDDRAELLAPGERIEGVSLTIDGQYTYDASHPIDRAEVVLFVDVNGVGFEEMGSTAMEDVPQSIETGSVSLNADLLEHSGLSVGMFDVNAGQTTTTTIAARLELRLFKNGAEVALADADGGAQLSVTKEELVVSAQLGGAGAMQVQRGTVTPA